MLGVGLETYKSYNLSYDPLKKVTKITKRWHEALAFKFTLIFCRHEALAFKSTSIFCLQVGSSHRGYSPVGTL